MCRPQLALLHIRGEFNLVQKKVKKTQKKSNTKNKSLENSTKVKTQEISILLFASSILLSCLILIKGENVWTFLHNFILGLFGVSALLLPILLCYTAFAILVSNNSKINLKIWQSVSIIFLFSTTTYLFSNEGKYFEENYFKTLAQLYKSGMTSKGSGLVSGILGVPCVAAFGEVGAKIIILLLLFVAIMLLTGTNLVQLFKAISKPVGVVKENLSENRMKKIQRENANIDIALNQNDFADGYESKKSSESKLNKLKKASTSMNSFSDDIELTTKKFLEKSKQPEPSIVENINQGLNTSIDGEYHYPNPMLLEKSVESNSADVAKELQLNGKMLVDTLENFSVHTKIVDISRGPAVTRYELQPAAGVKISKITNLSDDIALNLAASGVRIEAPIPGKAAVGVEIPNKIVSIVKMRELVSSKEFMGSKSKLSVILGKDIAGNVKVADLAKMPHLLIAGSTGSGKSVCINSFIISLLYKASPNEVKLLMVDPKVVELGIYNGIPHLLVPVVTDPRKAAGALNWAVTEMLKRYQMFAENNVRDITSYNSMVKVKLKNASDAEKENLKALPQIVIIIDELADLMMVAPNEVEDSICRLAQMARAAGMHLVIATQRPSVDVITGIIKANIPSRIALAVSSQIDSRTILDSGGAEKLLGRGDMLFSPVGSQKPVRIQGCFVSDKEIESVIEYIKESKENIYDSNIMDEIEKNAVLDKKEKDTCSDSDDDPMLQDAVKCILDNNQASTSLLQRKLRLGYARAGRIMDQMEQKGIVGPANGSKPREILISAQRWSEINDNKNFS